MLLPGTDYNCHMSIILVAQIDVIVAIVCKQGEIISLFVFALKCIIDLV